LTTEFIVGVGREALFTVLLVAGPPLGLGLAAGLIISLFQATTQIHEQTLVFVPKIMAVLVAVVLFGPWMIKVLVSFTTGLWADIPFQIS